jgi:hypothetical protein
LRAQKPGQSSRRSSKAALLSRDLESCFWLSSAKIRFEPHAATLSGQYSWCRPPEHCFASKNVSCRKAMTVAANRWRRSDQVRNSVSDAALQTGSGSPGTPIGSSPPVAHRRRLPWAPAPAFLIFVHPSQPQLRPPEQIVLKRFGFVPTGAAERRTYFGKCCTLMACPALHRRRVNYFAALSSAYTCVTNRCVVCAELGTCASKSAVVFAASTSSCVLP